MVKDNPRSPYYYIAVTVILIAVNLLLARYVAIPFAGIAGISLVYPAVAFMIAFTLWFGVIGAAAAYIGCFIGAGVLNQVPITVNLYWSLADLWQVLIPLIAFKTFKADIRLTGKKDWLVFLLFGWLLNNLVGAAWGAGTFVVGGVISPQEFASTFSAWLMGNLFVTIILTTLLLKFITPALRRVGLIKLS